MVPRAGPSPTSASFINKQSKCRDSYAADTLKWHTWVKGQLSFQLAPGFCPAQPLGASGA